VGAALSEEGEAGLFDRSSAPRRVHNRTCEARIEAIAALRRVRFTGAEIAEILAMPETTVSGILTRIGLGKLGRLGLEPAERYERARPGELLHIDVKKLGRIERPGHRVTGNRAVHARRTRVGNNGRKLGTAGWEFVHVCVDDATRLAYAEVLADERATTAIGFLRRAVTFYRRHGITAEQVMTDNGSAYRSSVHALACRKLGLRHLRTRPYRPQTNGKAERFIRTMLGEWAYGAIYANSAERTAALPGFLWRYNFKRNHGSLGRKPPAARLAELNNLLGSYS
jgi:transposase InsO family protein